MHLGASSAAGLVKGAATGQHAWAAMRARGHCCNTHPHAMGVWILYLLPQRHFMFIVIAPLLSEPHFEGAAAPVGAGDCRLAAEATKLCGVSSLYAQTCKLQS